MGVFSGKRVNGRQQPAHQRVGDDKQSAADEQLLPVAAKKGRKADHKRRQQMQRQLGGNGQRVERQRGDGV